MQKGIDMVLFSKINNVEVYTEQFIDFSSFQESHRFYFLERGKKKLFRSVFNSKRQSNLFETELFDCIRLQLEEELNNYKGLK